MDSVSCDGFFRAVVAKRRYRHAVAVAVTLIAHDLYDVSGRTRVSRLEVCRFTSVTRLERHTTKVLQAGIRRTGNATSTHILDGGFICCSDFFLAFGRAKPIPCLTFCSGRPMGSAFRLMR